MAQCKESSCQSQETHVQFLGQEDPLEEKMLTHSSILACEIPWTEETGRLQSQSRTGLNMHTQTFTIIIYFGA